MTRITRKTEPLHDYLDSVASSYYYLDFRGISALERVVSLALDEVFVPLIVKKIIRPQDINIRLLVSYYLDLIEQGNIPDRMFKTYESSFNAIFKKYNPVLNDNEISNEINTSMINYFTDNIIEYGNEYDIMQAEKILRNIFSSNQPEIIERFRKYIQRIPAGEVIDDSFSFTDIFLQHRQLVLLGDPGSGKTTLVKWLARGYALGNGAIEGHPAHSEHLIPIVVPIAAYALQAAKTDQITTLSDCLPILFRKATDSTISALRQAILDGHAIVLFDGLDEVPDENLRAQVLKKIRAFISSQAEKGADGCRCLMTSRIFGYDLCRIDDAVHYRLAPFEEPQIRRFIEGWAWALERALHPDAPSRKQAVEEQEELVRAIFEAGCGHVEALLSFAVNPLLLTILALVKRQFGILPELRVKLYDCALHTLMETWNHQRSLAGPLRGIALDADQLMMRWEPVALWMHKKYPGGTAPRDEIIEQLAYSLMAESGDRETALVTAADYLDTSARWAGVLIERGAGTFGFMHQTFQEYLAARALVRQASDPYEVLFPYLHAPRWREVVFLAAGYLGAIQQRTDLASDLVDRIRDTTDILEPHLHRYLYLAADLLADRVPVSQRCFDETAMALLAVVDEGVNSDKFISRIIGLVYHGVGEVVINRVAALFRNDSKAEDWRIRASLLLWGFATPQRTAEILARGLNDRDDDVRSLAAALLVAKNKVDENILETVQPEWSYTGVPALDRVAQRFVTSACRHEAVCAYQNRQLTTTDPEMRLHAVEMMQAAGTLSQTNQVTLVGLLRTENSMVQARALKLLLASKSLSPLAQAALEELLAEEDPRVRLSAIQVQQQLGLLSPLARAALVELLAEEDLSVRLSAVNVLQTAGALSEAAEVSLVEMLVEDDPVQSYVIICCIENESLRPAAQAALAKMLQSKKTHARLHAAEVSQAQRILIPEAQAALVDLLTDKDPQVRLDAISVLREVKPLPSAAQTALEKLLADEDPWVQLRAIDALQRVGPLPPTIQMALVNLLPVALADPGWRKNAIRILQTITPLSSEAQVALDKLLSAEDPELRLIVIQVLQAARSHPTTAQRTLEELLAVEETCEEAAILLAQQAQEEQIEGEQPSVWLRTLPAKPRQEDAAAGVGPVALPTPLTLVEAVDRALRAGKAEVDKVVADLRAAAIVNAIGGGAVGISFSNLKVLLESVNSHALAPVLADPLGGHGPVRTTILALVEERCNMLANQRRSAATAVLDDEERTLATLLPDGLLLEAAGRIYRGFGDAGRAALIARLTARAFDPDGPETEEMIGLYASLRDSAAGSVLAAVVRRIRQALSAECDAVRAVAGGCLASFLPHLDARVRDQAFAHLLTVAETDEVDAVKTAVRSALELVAGSLTPGERQRIPRA